MHMNSATFQDKSGIYRVGQQSTDTYFGQKFKLTTQENISYIYISRPNTCKHFGDQACHRCCTDFTRCQAVASTSLSLSEETCATRTYIKSIFFIHFSAERPLLPLEQCQLVGAPGKKRIRAWTPTAHALHNTSRASVKANTRRAQAAPN